MDKCTFFLFLACLLQLSSQDKENKYVAVVVEFGSLDFERNVQLYQDIIENAHGRFHTDLVVFPESTLTEDEGRASLVPDPKHKVIPYKNETYNSFKAMNVMSKTAARHKVYVVINLIERENCTKGQGGCPERGYFLYNTNVAFDRNGTVVARYRKVNIYDENVDRPKEQELSTFTTDFGVTFGLITGFDVLFKTPGIDLVEKKNIKNIIFTSRWYGELPFLTASQIQGGWSYATNVTLLASGANNPSMGSTGTGIYFGQKGFEGHMYERSGIAYFGRDISKIPNTTVYLPNENRAAETRGLKLLRDPSLALAKSFTLDFKGTQLKKTICHNGLCCKFDIDYVSLVENSPEDYTYKAVVFQGKRNFGEEFVHEVAYCAVVLCIRGNCGDKPSNDNFPLLFKKMNIQGEFRTKDTLQIPSTLTWKKCEDGLQLLHLMDYDSFGFERKEIGRVSSRVTMQLKSKTVKNLITFGIFGRTF